MSDTNVHRVVGNLLVGTSHFFVDTTTNQVGINTSSPSASLDVATGDVKVGSGITLANDGTITATGGFSGDGSGLSGVNSDSGSWVNGSSSNIHLAVSTDNVGIGVLDPSHKLDVHGDINISSGTLKVGGTPAVFSNWTVHTNGSDIYRSSGKVGIGVTSPDGPLHLNLPTKSNYTGFTYQSGDVKTVLGNAEGGTNTSFVQVYSGVTTSVPDTNSSTYNLALQPHGGNVGIGGVLQPAETLDILGTLRIGKPNGPLLTDADGMLTIDSRSNPSFNYGNESVCLQTTIDGRTLAQGANYASEDRCVLALQPDFGYVGVGTVSPVTKLDVRGNIMGESAKRNLFFHPPAWGYNTTSTSDTTLWSFTYNFPYDGYVILNTNGHWRNTSHGQWFYGKLGIDNADPADTPGFYDSYTGGAQSSHGGDFHEYEENASYWCDFNWGGTLKVSAGNRTICLRVRIQGGHLYVNGTAINMFYIPTKIF